MSSRKERYESWKKEKAKAEAEKNHGSFDLPDLKPIEYLPMTKDKCEVIRIVSQPWESAKDGTDGYRIKHSMMLGDKKYFNVNWSFNRDWPLNQLYYFLTKGEYNKDTRTKTYEYAGCPILKKVLTNNQDSPYASGWKPQEFVLMNVIDRFDMEWHKNHKATKVFTKDAEKNDEGKYYPSYGISAKGLYMKIQGCADDNMIHPCDTDFAIRRLSEKEGDNWYKVFVPEFEARPIEGLSEKDGIKYLDYASFDPLTDEELSWERVNFEEDPRYKVTSTIKIYNHIKNLVKDVDTKYAADIKSSIGCSFTELFEEKVEEERKLFQAMQEKNAAKTSTSSNEAEAYKEESTNEETPKEEKEAPTRKTSRRVTKEEPVNEEKSLEEVISEEYLASYKKLSEEERASIVGFDIEKDEYVFAEGVDTAMCPECDKFGDENVFKCPYCGIEFDD